MNVTLRAIAVNSLSKKKAGNIALPGGKLKTSATAFYLLLLLVLGSNRLSAQTDSVYWYFGTPGTATANATFSSNANVLAASCVADTGNACCAFTTTSGYTTMYFTTQFPSSGYPGASGEPTFRNNAKTGALNAATSTYFSFVVTPTPGYAVEIKSIQFAALKNATGPTGYTILTSADGYTTPVGSGTIGTSYGSAKKSHTGLSISAAAGAPITVRVYTHNSLVTGTGGNVFLDDMMIYYNLTATVIPGVTTGAITGSPFCSGAAVTVPVNATGTFNVGNIFTAQLSDAFGSFTTPINIGTLNGTASGNISATIPAGASAGTGYRVRVISSNPALTGADNGSDLAINPSVTASVTAAATPGSTICAGSSASFTATPTNGGTTPTYQWKKNGTNVGTNMNTYTDNALLNGAIITVAMTSSATCATPATATSTPIVMTVNASAANSVTITSTATTICAGTPVTFTATVPSVNTNPLVPIAGSVLTCTQGMTPTSVCVGANGSYASGWSGTGYWQYKISSTGYQDITFSTPTSSSATGPHTGALYYSTNGTTYTYVNTYSWGSGTGCATTGNILLPPAADNQANLYVRLVMVSSASGGTNRVNPDAFKGKVLQPSINAIYQWKKNGSNVGTNINTYTDNGLANNDVVLVEVSSNTCVTPAVATSNAITMTVNPVVTPAVSIAASATTICAGTSVTFTATPTNGGAAPGYQWKVNGTNAGTGSTLTTSTLANNDVVTCVMTSNATCPSTPTATSNAITMTVNPVLAPSVNITSTGNGICAGTAVTFTATPTNGGTTPSYQWKKNGTNVGINSDTYTDNTFANLDAITVVMTSNAICVNPASITSNTITMNVSVPLTPAVSIVASTSNTICDGTSVTFTATPANGGTTPVYQWKKNNTNVGANSTTYTDNALLNGDIITVEMTSNAVCLATPSATSNAITMTVNPLLAPTATVAVSPDDTICAGTLVTFTATPVNGGTSPTYQWQKNGLNVGGGNATYTDNGLLYGDVVKVIMTSNATCATPAIVTSNLTTLTVNPLLITGVIITDVLPNDTVCAGTSVTFTAKPKNGGTTPTYQWKRNGSNVGANSTTYTDNTLSNNDVISVVMTSNAVCPTPPTVATTTPVSMVVKPVLTPYVTISANPGTMGAPNQVVVFTAYISNAGDNPKIHWEKNGVVIPQMNSNYYITSILKNRDTIVCIVESNDPCTNGIIAISNKWVMRVGTAVSDVTNDLENITLYPNPNTGAFTIKGDVHTQKNINIEVLNSLGQIVYSYSFPVSNNTLNQQVTLPEIAKGAYLMRLHTEAESKVLRFIVQ